LKQRTERRRESAEAEKIDQASKRPDQSGQLCHIYGDILIEPNEWIREACREAIRSVKDGGGPFGAVLVQVDDETGEVIRTWKGRNQVADHNDPTAHAEISVIRAACSDLGVYGLGVIDRSQARLPQRCATSHCELYSSCEPCPMCYSAALWARIPVLVFSATCYEASHPDVGFSDEAIYEDLQRGYADRRIRVRQSICSTTLDAFKKWKKSCNPRY